MMSSDPNSPFLGVIGLGALKAEYKYSGRRRWIGLIFGVLCLLATPVLLLVTAWVAYQTYNDSGLYKVAGTVLLAIEFELLFEGVRHIAVHEELASFEQHVLAVDHFE